MWDLECAVIYVDIQQWNPRCWNNVIRWLRIKVCTVYRSTHAHTHTSRSTRTVYFTSAYHYNLHNWICESLIERSSTVIILLLTHFVKPSTGKPTVIEISALFYGVLVVNCHDMFSEVTIYFVVRPHQYQHFVRTKRMIICFIKFVLTLCVIGVEGCNADSSSSLIVVVGSVETVLWRGETVLHPVNNFYRATLCVARSLW